MRRCALAAHTSYYIEAFSCSAPRLLPAPLPALLPRLLPALLLALCAVAGAQNQEAEQEVENASLADIRLDFAGGVLAASGSEVRTNSDGDRQWLLHDATYERAPWRFSADEISAVPDTGRLDATGVVFFYGDTVNGHADGLHLESVGDDADKVHLRQFDLSFCAGEETGPGWSLTGGQLQIDERSNLATARRMSLRVLGVPLPGPPVARLRLDGGSATGFLAPILAVNNDDELDVALPFLWAWGRAADWTLTPRVLGSAGSGLESQLRYLLPAHNGVLSTAYLQGEDESWRALHWRHDWRRGDWHLNLDYADVPDADFLSRHGLASVHIGSFYGHYPRKLSATWRGDSAWVELLSQSFQGPEGGGWGDHVREAELRLGWVDRSGPWGWNLRLERGRYGRVGSDLYFGAEQLDRSLGAPDTVARLDLSGRLDWRWRAPWGWIAGRGTVRQSDQAQGWQRSLGAQFDAGLRFVNDLWQVEPRLNYRLVNFSASDAALQNLDSSLLAASVLSLWGEPVAGGDLVSARNRLTVGVDLWRPLGFAPAAGRAIERASSGGAWQLRAGLALSHYAAPPKKALAAQLPQYLPSAGAAASAS